MIGAAGTDAATTTSTGAERETESKESGRRRRRSHDPREYDKWLFERVRPKGEIEEQIHELESRMKTLASKIAAKQQEAGSDSGSPIISPVLDQPPLPMTLFSGCADEVGCTDEVQDCIADDYC